MKNDFMFDLISRSLAQGFDCLLVVFGLCLRGFRVKGLGFRA